MQITCTSLHTDKTHQYPTTLLFTGWMPFLPLNQQRQSAADNCWRMLVYIIRKSAVFVLWNVHLVVVMQVIFSSSEHNTNTAKFG